MTLPSGKPPKSADDIRKSLQGLKGTSDTEKTSGPKAQGLKPEDRLNIATFHNQEVARSFQRHLSQAGVMSTFKQASGQTFKILVDYEDREQANEILADHQLEFPDRRPKGFRREFDYLMLGGVLGLSIGAIFIVGAFGDPLALTAPIPFAGIGALSGHIVDRMRMHYRNTGRIGFGVWEFLVLAPIPALMAFVWHLLPLILRKT